MINKFGFYDALEDSFDPSIPTYSKANTAGQRVKSRTFSRCALGYGNMGCFQRRDTKLDWFLAKTQHRYTRDIIVFCVQCLLNKPLENELLIFGQIYIILYPQTWNSTTTITIFWVRRGGKFSLTNLHPSSRWFILTSIHC